MFSKKELRQHIRQLKKRYSSSQLEELSQPIIDRLRPQLAEAQVILAYYSLPDEPCTHQLIDDLVAKGKLVLLPKVLDATTMELRCYNGPQDLVESSLHIMEPSGAPFTDYSLIDVALIPGIAFDTQGHRLGRGRGYYDRFLCKMDTCTKRDDAIPTAHRARLFGICFDFQKVDSVPVDINDISVDMVI